MLGHPAFFGDMNMKLEDKKRYQTIGFNSFSITANILIAGVVFGTLNPWWLCLAAPIYWLGAGIELHEKKENNINFTAH